MSERDLSGIWFTVERERNISGVFALAVSNWAERTPTKQNIELSVTPLRFAHMICVEWRENESRRKGDADLWWWEGGTPAWTPDNHKSQNSTQKR